MSARAVRADVKVTALGSPEFRLTHMTAEELLACCDAAHARQEIDQRFGHADDWKPPFEFAMPTSVKNEELKKIEGLYSSILTAPKLRARLMETLRTKQPDGAAGLLYFLEFPKLVFSARNDTLGLQGHATGTAEKFPLKNVLTQIQKDEEILRFCRQTLDDAAAHSIVIASCIGLLNGSILVGAVTKKKLGPVIVGGEGEPAIGAFFDTVARNVTRSNLPPGSIVDGVSLAAGVHQIFTPRYNLCEMQSAPLFVQAISSIQTHLGDASALQMRCLFESTLKEHDLQQLLRKNLLTLAPYSAADMKEDAKQLLRSESISLCAAGCGMAGDKKCAKCKLASYCSVECQKAHWKTHKKVCKKQEDCNMQDSGSPAELAEKYATSMESKRRAQKRAELDRLLAAAGACSLPRFLATKSRLDLETSRPAGQTRS